MFAALFTALLLLLWLRILPIRRFEAVTNPLLSVPLNQADRVVNLIRPVFGTRATQPFVAFVLLILLLALRGALYSATHASWFLTIGPALFTPNTDSPRECILFSFLSFGWLLERIWLLVFVFGSLRRKHYNSLEDGFARALASPVSDAPRWLQFLIITLFSVVLSHATISAGFACNPGSLFPALADSATGPWAELLRMSNEILPDFQTTTPRALALMLAGTFAEVFSVSVEVVVALIIASFIGLFLRLSYWIALSNASLAYFVGTFFRNTLRIGGISFAPLVYLLLAAVLSFVLYNGFTFIALSATGAFTPETLEAVRELLESAS